jgi:hypothetical protein
MERLANRKYSILEFQLAIAIQHFLDSFLPLFLLQIFSLFCLKIFGTSLKLVVYPRSQMIEKSKSLDFTDQAYNPQQTKKDRAESHKRGALIHKLCFNSKLQKSKLLPGKNGGRLIGYKFALKA